MILLRSKVNYSESLSNCLLFRKITSYFDFISDVVFLSSCTSFNASSRSLSDLIAILER